MTFIEWTKTAPIIGKFSIFIFKLFNLKKENTSLKTEINILKEKYEKLSEAHKNTLNYDVNLGIWFGSHDGLAYCAKCKAYDRISPLKNDDKGWICPACGERP